MSGQGRLNANSRFDTLSDAMLLEGLGWGNMPIHLVKDHIDRGRL